MSKGFCLEFSRNSHETVSTVEDEFPNRTFNFHESSVRRFDLTCCIFELNFVKSGEDIGFGNY